MQSTTRKNGLRQDGFPSRLSPEAARAFESIKLTTRHPEGTVLFLEHEQPRGIYLIGSGRVKLSVSSRTGKTLITQIAGAGEIIGLTATLSGIECEATAETLYPSEISFIRREHFVRFLAQFPEVYGLLIGQLNLQYGRACEQLRTIGLSNTVQEKLARLFLNWSSDDKMPSNENELRIPLTHEQIASCLGSTRETVTRTLTQFKNKHLITLKGVHVMISDRSALRAVSGD